MPTLTTFFLGMVFLLFPLAHLRLLGNIPMYLSEIPLIIAFGIFLFSRFFEEQTIAFVKKVPWLVTGVGFFVSGACITALLSGNFLSTLGLLKSFIVLPVVFMSLVAIFTKKETDQYFFFLMWWLGIFSSALAGLILFSEGILTYDGRLTSLYTSPNSFAMLLSPGVLIGIWLFLKSPTRSQAFFGFGTLIILLALFLTRSYASLGALFLSGNFFFFLRKNQWHSIVKATFVLVLIGGTWIWVEGTTTKFQTFLDFQGRSSSASRLIIWEAALKISKENFPWGIGLGRFQETYLAYQKFFPPYLEWAVPEPHNLFLSLYLSTGLIGLGGFFFTVWRILRGLWQQQKNLKGFQALTARLYLTLIFWFLLVGLVDTPYFKNDLTFALWGVFGLASTLLFLEREKTIN